jgi:hypothetical protein
MVEDHLDDLAVMQQDCKGLNLFRAINTNRVSNVATDCITLTLPQGSSSTQANITPLMVVELLFFGEAFCSYLLV